MAPKTLPIVRGALALVAAGLLIHCGEQVTGPGSPGDTLTLAVRRDVTGFFPNPHFTNDTYTQAINWNIVTGLVRFDSRRRPVPALAESWESPDEHTYIFHLRPGLRFSNGEPVRAADVVTSFETARARGLPPRDALSGLEAIDVAGPRQVRIRTSIADPFLVYRLPFGFVIPGKAFEKSPAEVVGAGPFRLVSWTPARELVLERNPHYWGPAPGFERVRIRVVSRAEERVRLLLDGEVQLADDVPLDRLDALRTQPGIEVVAALSTRVLMLVFGVAEQPFSDPRVREAFDLAVDRRTLVERALSGFGEPASQLVAPSILGYNPQLQVKRSDRERARRLLSEAGHPEGFAIRLDTLRNRHARDPLLLQELVEQLAEVGVRVEVNTLEKQEYFPLIESGRSRLHLLGWSCDTGEAGSVLEAKVHSRAGLGLGGDNAGGFSDPSLDELIEQARGSQTLTQRIELHQQALARAAELRPLLPLVVQPEALAVSRKVRWQPTIDYALQLEELRPADE